MSLLFLCTCTKDKKTLFKLKPSEETGITFNNRIVETDTFNILTQEYIFNGGGVAVGDFDNDSKPDLFFTGNQVANKLYLNQSGFKFKDVSLEAGIEAKDNWCTGVAVVDINHDQKLDLYVCSAMSENHGKRANKLFVNQGLNSEGIPVFKEMAREYGIADSGNSMGAAFFDYDKDGLLDLYVLNNEQTHILPTNYRKKVTDGSAVSNDKLYHNNGDGSFTDVTIEAGITIEGFGLGIAVSDLNYDSWPDLYITNDYLTNDLLYINNGDGTFSNDIKGQLGHQSKFSMGSDVSDYNNDGLLDIVTLDMLGETNERMKTTIGHNPYITYNLNKRWDYEPQYSRNMLHRGNGLGIPYSEVGLMAGISKTDWSWSPLFVDMDNDGMRDLLITNGFPRDITDKDFADFKLGISRYVGPEKILDSIPVAKVPNYAYKNMGNSLFSDVGTDWGLAIASFSNGAAYVDLDEDGDMDYVVNNINDEAFVFENTSNEKKELNQFLNVKFKGPPSNPLGIGTKLVLRYDDERFQYYEQNLTRGYMSSVSPTAHFGLGKPSKDAAIEVLWPDGHYQKLQKTKPDQTLIVDYDEAGEIDPSKLSFPLVPQKTTTLFSELSDSLNIHFVHQEHDIVDYNVQRVLPHKLTQNGPCVEAGDLNGDGLEDFIVGSSSGFSPILFFQSKDGTFHEKPLFIHENDKKYEEQDIVMFDIENDGDLDLYLVSGSNEFEKDSEYYTDRLMLNQGNGTFKETTSKTPEVNASGSVVRAQDFDHDGFVDLFVGGRTPYGQYPLADQSFLLKNLDGKLVDVTDTIIPDLRKIGMVTDAEWVDIDGDSLIDLVVVGELMPITLFKNQGSSFEKMRNTDLDKYLGWWKSVISEDFDNDGDKDLIVGNLGDNNFYRPSQEKPVTIVAKDFDNNGSIDPVMFAYFKNKDGKYGSYPVNFWGDLFGQSPLFRSKFDLYKDYSKATENNLFTPDELKGTEKWIGNYDKSIYVENLGNGRFEISPLPIQAQIAPINDIAITDFNGDGNQDVLLIGNDYGNEVFIGKYDAFHGLLLQGNGKGGFKSIPVAKSGFLVPGDAKRMVIVKSVLGGSVYVIAQNKGQLLMYRKN